MAILQTIHVRRLRNGSRPRTKACIDRCVGKCRNNVDNSCGMSSKTEERVNPSLTGSHFIHRYFRSTQLDVVKSYLVDHHQTFLVQAMSTSIDFLNCSFFNSQLCERTKSTAVRTGMVRRKREYHAHSRSLIPFAFFCGV